MRLGMHWHPHKGGATHYHEARQLGQDFPAAIVLGGDPSLIFAAIAPLPENINELLNIEIYLINKYLVKGGSFLAKCFQGSSFDHLKEFMKENFKEVVRIKPEASRTSSKECYLLGKFKK